MPRTFQEGDDLLGAQRRPVAAGSCGCFGGDDEGAAVSRHAMASLSCDVQPVLVARSRWLRCSTQGSCAVASVPTLTTTCVPRLRATGQPVVQRRKIVRTDQHTVARVRQVRGVRAGNSDVCAGGPQRLGQSGKPGPQDEPDGTWSLQSPAYGPACGRDHGVTDRGHDTHASEQLRGYRHRIVSRSRHKLFLGREHRLVHDAGGNGGCRGWAVDEQGAGGGELAA